MFFEDSLSYSRRYSKNFYTIENEVRCEKNTPLFSHQIVVWLQTLIIFLFLATDFIIFIILTIKTWIPIFLQFMNRWHQREKWNIIYVSNFWEKASHCTSIAIYSIIFQNYSTTFFFFFNFQKTESKKEIPFTFPKPFTIFTLFFF